MGKIGYIQREDDQNSDQETFVLVDDLKDQLEDAHAEIATLKTVVKQKDDEIAHLKSNTHYSNYASMTLQKEISSLRRRSEKRITELETTLSNSTQVLSMNTTTT